jgi:WD40 repeat protein
MLRTMKTVLPLLAALTLLSACSPAVNVTSTASVELAATAIIETATETSLPSPSPNALPPQINAGNVDNLSVYLTFGYGEILRSLAFSPDGTVLASAGGNNEDFDIRVWDVNNGQLLHTLQGHTSIVWGIAFSPDGALLASASSDRTVKIWDWSTETLLHTFDFRNEIVSVEFSLDGQTLAVGGVDEWPNAAIWTYSVPSWQPLLKLAEYWNIPDLAYSPDGQLLVGGGTSRNVRVWRTSDGAEQFVLYHSGQVSSLDISPDGATLATSLCEASDANSQCIRGAVWLWDLRSGSLITSLADFTDWGTSVAYSLDGSVVLTGSRDGSLSAYSTANFAPLLVTNSPGGDGVLAISPDGRFMATTGNGEIHVWRVGP